MPEMTGEKLAKEILPVRPDIPIILNTGFSHTITEPEANKFGIKKMVVKPLEGKALLRLVRGILDLNESE